MANSSPMAVAAPRGQLADFIGGTFCDERPEGYVSQQIAKSLAREYLYARADTAVEYGIKVGSATKRADPAMARQTFPPCLDAATSSPPRPRRRHLA